MYSAIVFSISSNHYQFNSATAASFQSYSFINSSFPAFLRRRHQHIVVIVIVNITSSTTYSRYHQLIVVVVILLTINVEWGRVAGRLRSVTSIAGVVPIMLWAGIFYWQHAGILAKFLQEKITLIQETPSLAKFWSQCRRKHFIIFCLAISMRSRTVK